jgi:hypothetical protein
MRRPRRRQLLVDREGRRRGVRWWLDHTRRPTIIEQSAEREKGEEEGGECLDENNPGVPGVGAGSNLRGDDNDNRRRRQEGPACGGSGELGVGRNVRTAVVVPAGR